MPELINKYSKIYRNLKIVHNKLGYKNELVRLWMMIFRFKFLNKLLIRPETCLELRIVLSSLDKCLTERDL